MIYAARKESETCKFEPNLKSTVWVDTETMDFVKLSRNVPSITGIKIGSLLFNDLISGKGKYTGVVQYEYDKVKIDDRLLLVPVTKTDRYFRKKQLVIEYKYKYSDYRMFDVKTNIKFNPID